jgi:hypothetical protein
MNQHDDLEFLKKNIKFNPSYVIGKILSLEETSLAILEPYKDLLIDIRDDESYWKTEIEYALESEGYFTSETDHFKKLTRFYQKVGNINRQENDSLHTLKNQSYRLLTTEYIKGYEEKIGKITDFNLEEVQNQSEITFKDGCSNLQKYEQPKKQYHDLINDAASMALHKLGKNNQYYHWILEEVCEGTSHWGMFFASIIIENLKDKEVKKNHFCDTVISIGWNKNQIEPVDGLKFKIKAAIGAFPPINKVLLHSNQNIDLNDFDEIPLIGEEDKKFKKYEIFRYRNLPLEIYFVQSIDELLEFLYPDYKNLKPLLSRREVLAGAVGTVLGVGGSLIAGSGLGISDFLNLFIPPSPRLQTNLFSSNLEKENRFVDSFNGMTTPIEFLRHLNYLCGKIPYFLEGNLSLSKNIEKYVTAGEGIKCVYSPIGQWQNPITEIFLTPKDVNKEFDEITPSDIKLWLTKNFDSKVLSFDIMQFAGKGLNENITLVSQGVDLSDKIYLKHQFQQSLPLNSLYDDIPRKVATIGYDHFCFLFNDLLKNHEREGIRVLLLTAFIIKNYPLTMKNDLNKVALALDLLTEALKILLANKTALNLPLIHQLMICVLAAQEWIFYYYNKNIFPKKIDTLKESLNFQERFFIDKKIPIALLYESLWWNKWTGISNLDLTKTKIRDFLKSIPETRVQGTFDRLNKRFEDQKNYSMKNLNKEAGSLLSKR